ncbi:hypothetical protein EON65_48900 [archaeon]|nr:MAG: hypothetical protein EON65_48900 [archaeon]
MLTLQEAFAENEQVRNNRFRRHFPYLNTLRFVMQHPKLIGPGLQLGVEITKSYLNGKTTK